MKLSIEAKVAAAVAAAFAVLSIGAIAQEQSQRGTSGPSGYSPTDSPAFSRVSMRGSESSLSGLHDGKGEDQILGLY